MEEIRLLVELGKELGYSGEELREFVKLEQNQRRDDRQRQREE